ncbi:helix-turn-helix domain-containing protein [Salmonella enterica]|nr:helix-turn-helix domain-containing protein [Salmonella enterica]EKB5474196.1 helix-turn-helix domain-containing protein [Salmonella enterica]EKC2614700.1 helix-turn-helix domain-containing protein [Salmonella enterica]EKC2692739.1 helix-turn-helix domain-containing protein [Salmonella enterica]ELL0513908.1 helix-turn-helix domain-containing protein [Salmonella enterica]
MKSCNGLSLNQSDVIANSLQIISVAGMLRATQNYTDIADALFDIAQQYLEEAATPSNKQLCAPYDGRLSIGERIQLARRNLGMSLDDLAAAVIPGDVEVLLEWENNKSEPCASEIIRLSQTLKCDPMWLLTGKSHHEPVAHTVMPSSPVEVMQNVDVSTIGKRIGVARVNQRMCTEELENAIHAPEGSVFRWETGKAIPSSQYIDILARTLNVSVTWLLTGKEIAKES